MHGVEERRMKVSARSALSIRRLAIITVCFTLGGLLTTVHAGMRGRGKYSGVVIFDRWDTCFLISGSYITYISEAVKEQLRSYAGQAVQISVNEITQPTNPGDGLVNSYVILGQATDDPSNPITDNVEIRVEPGFDGKKASTFAITLRNDSLLPVPVSPSEVGITLLGINRGVAFSASDGKSVAWITRADLSPHGPNGVAESSWTSTVDGKTVYATYKTAQPCAFRSRIKLAAHDSVSCRVRLDVPAGEYQFMAGYGGGVHAWKSIASNAVSFNVDDAGVSTVEP
jgi:hypothetical protein